MFDGKCVNALTNSPSSNCCSVRHSKPKEIAIVNSSFKPVEGTTKFGMELLYVTIRVMEHFLQLAYELVILCWCLWKHSKDEKLMKGIFLLIKLYRCKTKLSIPEVRKLWKSMYVRYHRLYGAWAMMSPTLHKLLAHGPDIAEEFEMSLAYYAGDALETWHKFLRRFTTTHARQSSREARITDLSNRAVYWSDPVIIKISLNRRTQKPVSHGITKSIAPYILKTDLEGITFEEENEDAIDFEIDSDEEADS
ncbi:hypothetical protein QAD02_013704 [Eretmocerus hayati]|uniref:Uncharacterized protein n=1 Tax=Eretmocerus hayati TaxID=131215 RepID=A0ACC2P3F4_9HYME|nr:hypothetical protein QAD02_013704 [Eretmocerus hayati]